VISDTLKWIIGLLALLSAGVTFAAANPDSYMPTELIAESEAPKPGSTVLLGFRMSPKPGWHGYWSNPGDAGIVPTVRWTAPSGVTFGPLLHPAPTLISDSGINSFVHKGQHVLLTRMKVPASIEPGTPLPVRAKLDWAACTATQCVPLSATFSLDLVAGDGTQSAKAAIIQSALRQLPKTAPEATYSLTERNVRLHIPSSLRLNSRRVRFFPDENDAFATADSRAFTEKGAVVIEAPAKSASPKSLTGVVADGRSAYRIRFLRAEAETAGIQENEPAAAEPAEEAQPVPKPSEIRPRSPSSPAENESPVPWLWIALAGGVALAMGAFALAKRA